MPEEEIAEGTKVRTLAPLHDDRFLPQWLPLRKWGVEGRTTKAHHGHGLCYEVEHEDGSVGVYEPDEIRVLTKSRYELARNG